MENLAGLKTEFVEGTLSAFTAEELVLGPREKYSLETTFTPMPTPDHDNTLSSTMRQLVNAFMHWTYEVSGHTSFISGLQGVGQVITEGVVHDVQ